MHFSRLSCVFLSVRLSLFPGSSSMTEAGTLVPSEAGSTESETAAVAGGPSPLSAKAVYVPASPAVSPTI